MQAHLLVHAIQQLFALSFSKTMHCVQQEKHHAKPWFCYFVCGMFSEKTGHKNPMKHQKLITSACTVYMLDT